MQSSAYSPAPSKRTGIGGDSSGGATAAQLAATRADINAGYAEESGKSHDAACALNGAPRHGPGPAPQD